MADIDPKRKLRPIRHVGSTVLCSRYDIDALLPSCI